MRALAVLATIGLILAASSGAYAHGAGCPHNVALASPYALYGLQGRPLALPPDNSSIPPSVSRRRKEAT